MRVVSLVLAAGSGTRMRSATPKVLHEVVEKPLLQRAVEPVRALAHRLVVVVGPDVPAYETALAGLEEAPGPDPEFVVQDPPRGTGDAVRRAREALAGEEGTLLVTCGDVPNLTEDTLRHLLEVHQGSGGTGDPAEATVLGTVLEDPTGYGRLLVASDGDPRGALTRIVEQADATPEEAQIRKVNTGVYAFRIPLLWEILEELEADNAQGEVYLTDVVRLLPRDSEGSVRVAWTSDPEEARGVNSRADLARACRTVWNRNADRLLEAGATVLDPASTYIADGVRVEPDVRIHPGAILQGDTSLASRAEVGPGSRLRNCRLETGARVLDHCVLEDTRLGSGAEAGPFARMRGGVELGPEAVVGNFVEVKKSKLGRGTKAKHLSYLGDATLGEGVNVGAGTITCNHDGRRKHPTHLENGAYIGSNSTLVAPVTVRPGAYVGAGSVITQEVPADALALARCRQTVKEGWAARRREASAEEGGG